MSDQNYPQQYSEYYPQQTSGNGQNIPMAGDFPGGPPMNSSEHRFVVPALPNRDLHPQSRPGSSSGVKNQHQYGSQGYVINVSNTDGMDRKPAVFYQQQTVVYPQQDKRPEAFRPQQYNQVSQKVIEQMHAPRPELDKYPILNKKLQAINPVIPDATMRYICKRHGGEPNDDVTCRAISVAAEKLGVDLIADAISIARSRGMGQVNRSTKETKYTLTKALLREVAQEHGISLP